MIELVASLTILVVGIVGVIGVMNGTFSVAGTSSSRSRAISIATREIEKYRATTWNDLRAPDSPAPTSESVGGQSFTIERGVVWGSELCSPPKCNPAVTYANAYKDANVIVTWADSAGLHHIRQQTHIYPGGLGPYQATTTTAAGSCTPPTAPSLLTASVSVTIVGTSAIALAWVAGGAGTSNYVVQYSTDNFATAHEVADVIPATANAYIVTGLSSNTQYKFRVAGESNCGAVSTWSNESTAATAVSVAVCDIGLVNLTPASQKRVNASSKFLVGDVAVSVNTSGSCTGLTAVYEPILGVPRTAVLAAGGAGEWRGTINGTATAWSLGMHEVKIVDGANAVRAKAAVFVCAHNANRCP